MLQSKHRKLLLIAAPIALVAACSAAGGSQFSGSNGTGAGSGSGPSGSGAGNETGPGGAGGQVNITIGSGVGTGSGMSTGSAMDCVVTNPDVDMDGDGWTPNQGDCNDCDPNVNPGAIDVPIPNTNPVQWGNEACDNNAGVHPCDSGLLLADTNAADGAKAIELCQTTTETPATPQMKTWGVISSSYVRANGNPFASPDLQVGIQPKWGDNVHVQGGSNMLVISSGHARTPGQQGACGSLSCYENANATAPAGFPQNNPNCPPSMDIHDDIGLELKIRAPTNATGYSFNFKFYSFEYPQWVCDSYNDQFIALVSPAPQGSINGNISFDSMHNPVSVNLGFFTVCDPNDISEYAENCPFDNFTGTCPSPPSPYCPAGTADLIGTGFDIWNPGENGIAAGATAWLTSQAPIKGGEEFTIRFAMWDTGDQNFDSTTLIDNWQWIANGGTVTVVTNPVPMPQ